MSKIIILSPQQLLWLRLVNADTPSGGHRASDVQPSLRALERRGLVVLTPDRRTARGKSWTITLAGMAWLKENP